MKKKILTLILVLIGWTMSASAQTYKFLPDNTDGKNILVYKQSKNADTMIFVKKVAVPEILAKSVTTGTLATSLNENVNDSFVYDTSLLSKSSIPSKYYILPPASFDTYYYKGMHFSAKELSFKALTYTKTSVDNLFSGDVILGLGVLSLSITLLLSIMLGAKFVLAMIFGIRTSHDLALYVLLYLFMSTFFSYVISWKFLDLWVMIYFILPFIISAVSAHFLIEKKLGYKRVS
jgi:hypothetical protein